MKKLLAVMLLGMGALTSVVGVVSAAGRFDTSIQRATEPIQQHLEGAGFAGAAWGTEWVRDTIITLVSKVIVPAIIIIGVLMAIVGFYEIMTSEKEDDQKKGFRYILWGVVGIMVMMSASFIGNRLVGSGGVFDFTAFQGNLAAWKLYSLIIFPFLKMIMFVVIGVLFLILILHMYRFLMHPDEKIKQHARTIMVWNGLGILLIIFAKGLVESIYGRQEDVINPSATSLSDIGTGILADKSFGWLYVVLNRVMGIVWFVILVLIIIEAIDLLRNPTDEKQMEKIKRNFLYIVIGILIIGTAYVVTNFVVLQ